MCRLRAPDRCVLYSCVRPASMLFRNGAVEGVEKTVFADKGNLVHAHCPRFRWELVDLLAKAPGPVCYGSARPTASLAWGRKPAWAFLCAFKFPYRRTVSPCEMSKHPRPSTPLSLLIPLFGVARLMCTFHFYLPRQSY